VDNPTISPKIIRVVQVTKNEKKTCQMNNTALLNYWYKHQEKLLSIKAVRDSVQKRYNQKAQKRT